MSSIYICITIGPQSEICCSGFESVLRSHTQCTPPPPPRVLFLLEEADSKYVICFLSLPHLPVPSFPLFHCLLVRLPFLPFVGVPLSVMPSPSSLCLTVTQPHTQTGCLCVTFCLLSPVTFSSSFQLPFPSHTVLY